MANKPEGEGKSTEYGFDQAAVYGDLEGELDIDRDRKAAAKLDKKAEKLYDHPIAKFNIEQEDYQPTVESGLPPYPDPVITETLAQEVSEPMRLVDKESGLGFNFLFANREALSEEPKRLVIFMAPFGNTIGRDGDGEGPTNYRFTELARQTGLPTLTIDHPALGGSDELGREQKRELAKNGYDYIAVAQLRAIKQLEGVGDAELVLVGISQGADAVLAQSKKAAELGFKVGNLILIEPPGAEEISVGKLSKDFASEGKYLDVAQSKPYDPRMRHASGFAHPIRRMLKLPIGLMKQMRAHGYSYAKNMARGKLQENLSTSLEANPEMKVNIIHGTASTIAPDNKVKVIVQDLGSRFGRERVSEQIYPGESHTVMENAKRFAALVNRVIGLGYGER